MFLYGASGHAKVIMEILDSAGITVDGLFDDDLSIKKLMKYIVLPFSPSVAGQKEVIISIGNNAVRKKIADKYDLTYGIAVHSAAVLSPSCKVAKGSVIMAGATINAEVEIGAHCIINTNASVDHDCRLEDFIHISPNVAICGDVRIGTGSHIGAGSVIIPGKKIGKNVAIGAGSVVITDIPDNAIAFGNPCRVRIK